MIKDIYYELSGIIGHRSMRVFLARKGVDLSNTTVHKYMNKEIHLQTKEIRIQKGMGSQALSGSAETKFFNKEAQSGLVYGFYIFIFIKRYSTLQLHDH